MGKSLVAVALFFAVQFVGVSPVNAQPDENNAPKGVNPPNRAVKPKATRAEQIAKRRARKIEARVEEIRLQLTQAGFTDPVLQTTIVDYYNSEQEARAKISDQYLQVVAAVRDKTTTDTQIVPLLIALRTSVAEEKIRVEKSSADFSAKLKLDQNPRLDALLMTQGVTGNERAFASQASGVDYLVNALGDFKAPAVKAN